MEKLKLEHLAPYLPYELRVKNQKTGVISPMVSHYPANPKDGIHYSIPISHVTNNIESYKPLLHPLSDLNKKEYQSFESWEFVIDKEEDAELSYFEWQHLFENHFDVFGLIEKGLAININTLKN